MDSETLERIKRNMEANRFSEAALTVISLSEGLELVAEVERLREAISLSGVAETMKKYVAEIERLEAEVKRLKDDCDQLEGERVDACDLRNFAYIERDELRAKNKKLRDLLKSVTDYLGTPWFNDWPTAQAKLSEVEAAIANLAERSPQ